MHEELPVCRLLKLADGLSLPFDSRKDDGLLGDWGARLLIKDCRVGPSGRTIEDCVFERSTVSP